MVKSKAAPFENCDIKQSALANANHFNFLTFNHSFLVVNEFLN